MKTCKKCGAEKPLSEFHRHPRMKDGHLNECKSCRVEYIKSWSERNGAKVSSYKEKYRENNPDRVIASREKWIAGNTTKELEVLRITEYRAKNKEKCAAAAKAWSTRNKDKIRTYDQNRRAKELNTGKISFGLRDRLFTIQRGKCACCGEPLGADFHLDHIMPLALGGSNTDDNIQLLRRTCNLQKNARHPVEFMQSRGYLL